MIDFKTNSDFIIPLPEPSYLIYGSSNPSYDTRKFRYGYASLVSPSLHFELDLDTNTQELLKERPVNNTIAANTPLSVSSSLLTMVSRYRYPSCIELISIGVRHNRFTLHGYGSYGASLDPLLFILTAQPTDRGVVFAMAHIRGGGEMGRQWYEDGKVFLKKKEYLLDFIAVSEGLIEQGYTSSDKLSIIGGSAGGLLIGASINMRPDLYNAAVADVPFVDVVTTMLDDSIPPPTTGEMVLVGGNPAQKNTFDHMLSYSPYDNVTAQDHPHLLVTSGLNDPRFNTGSPQNGWPSSGSTNRLQPAAAAHQYGCRAWRQLRSIWLSRRPSLRICFLLDKWGLAAPVSEQSSESHQNSPA